MNSIQNIKKKLFEFYYSFLNDKQKEAVFAPAGPTLVIAGAGSGKTTVLVNRISYLIHFGSAYHAEFARRISPEEIAMLRCIAENPALYGKEAIFPILLGFAANPIAPHNILAITFTNKAAGEIKERLERQIGDRAKDVWAGTFHSVCVRILRYFADHTEYGKDFVIYDQDDCKKIITRLLKEREIEDQELTPKFVMNVISKAKNSLLSPKEFEERNRGSEKRRICSELFYAYQKELHQSNAMDFDDLITVTVNLLRQDPLVLEWCQNKFRCILVDEYQDTNRAQYLLLKMIAEKHRNITAVGDDDQSIYKFRGATVENILNFDKEFEGTKVILLEQNYRSTQNIINAANGLIFHNESRRGKKLWAAGEKGRLVEIRQLQDNEKEAVYVAETIGNMVKNEHYQFRDFAILYRTKAQSNALEMIFTKFGLPHRLLAGLRFYDHAEVKDVLAYLRFIQNKNDFVSFSRIINIPKRGIGAATVEKIRSIADEKNLPVFEVLKRCAEFEELKRSYAKLSSFVRLIEMLEEFADGHSPAEVLHKVLDETGYLLTLLGEENEDRRKNVEELLSSAKRYEEHNPDGRLVGFLEEIALVSDVDNYDQNANSIVLMTVHAAKGLEFPAVFLVGMEENLFPSARSVLTEDELEEERRLAYVAMTRAKTDLIITCCHRRMSYGKYQSNEISRFVREIPTELVTMHLYQPVYESHSDFFKMKRDSSAIYSVRSFDPPRTTKFTPREKPTSHPSAIPPAAPKKPFSPGDRVVHGIFGAGTVLESKSVASDTLYVIRFDRVGEKKLMATYAKLDAEK